MTDEPRDPRALRAAARQRLAETTPQAAEHAIGPLHRDPLLGCLLRVAGHFDRSLSEAEVRASVPVSPGGMTVDEFRRAADRLGFETAPMPLDAVSQGQAPTPFVALGECGPVRVVLVREGGTFVVYDPVGDRLQAESGRDLVAWADSALLVRPRAATGAPAPRDARKWRRGVLWRLRGVVWEIGLASLMLNLFALAMPLFVMALFNKVIGQRALATLDVLALGMLAIFAFELVLRLVRSYIAAHSGARLESLLGGEVLHHLLRLPYRHFESTAGGVIAERLRQLDVLRAFFAGQLPLVLVDLGFVVIFLAVLFLLSPLIGAIVLATLPLFVGLSLIFHGRQRRLSEQSFLAQAAKSSALQEAIAGALTVKSLGLEPEIERRWENRLAAAAWTGFRAGRTAGTVSGLGTTVQHLASLLILYVGAGLVIDGALSIGALIAANILATRALAPMRQVAGAWQQVQDVRAALRRLDEVMAAEAEAAPGSLSAEVPLRGDIRFEDVSFTYDGAELPAIADLDLEIGSGRMLGVVGPPGGGKSTLGKLLLGLYRPQSGRVLIDGTDLSHVAPAALRRQIGVVPQEVQLFAGTVRDNIIAGVAESDQARVVAVAKFVGAHDFIQRLPRGYDTVLGERGQGLSAGQRQLIAIARALIRNPRILIFDEATSDLDPATEERFMRNLRRASRGRTILVISHRMAPVSLCDEVAYLADGRLERVGAPAEVVEAARGAMARRAEGLDR